MHALVKAAKKLNTFYNNVMCSETVTYSISRCALITQKHSDT